MTCNSLPRRSIALVVGSSLLALTIVGNLSPFVLGQQPPVPSNQLAWPSQTPVQIDMRPVNTVPAFPASVPYPSFQAFQAANINPQSDETTSPQGGGRMQPPNMEMQPPGDQPTSEEIAAAQQGVPAVAPDSDEPPLKLADVIASVYTTFPQIQQSRLQADVTAGERISAMGSYDLKLQGYSLGQPTGFYRNYQNGIGVARQLWWGGYLSAGYRVGRGSFQPWYKERETDEGGEFKVSIVQPLLQGRAIDPQRVALFQANLRQQSVGPEVQTEVLAISNEAAYAYWGWVASGGYLQAQRELYNLTKERESQLTDLVNAGKQKGVDLLFNQQLLAERRVKVLETEQKFRESGFKLSLYLRDEMGQPLVPSEDWLPPHFPLIELLPPGDFNADLNAAFERRPEPQVLALLIQQIQWDYRLANNQLLPQLDWVMQGSQDVGSAATSANDKDLFELEFGVQGEVPLQRRKARGKMISTQAKIAQLQTKLDLIRNKIGIELQTARNALELAAESVIEGEKALRSSLETVRRYRFGLAQGSGDLVYINILETKVNEYEIKLIESQLKWFLALAEFQLAMGLDPIEQAIGISNLPDAKTPQPGDFPEFRAFETDKEE